MKQTFQIGHTLRHLLPGAFVTAEEIVEKYHTGKEVLQPKKTGLELAVEPIMIARPYEVLKGFEGFFPDMDFYTGKKADDDDPKRGYGGGGGAAPASMELTL